MSPNIYFLGVARMTGNEAILVASIFNKTGNLKHEDVKKVLVTMEKPVPEKHYNFAQKNYEWHLIAPKKNVADTEGLLVDTIYIVICEEGYPIRRAHDCLEDLYTKFVSSTCYKEASVKKDKGLDKEFRDCFKSICVKHDITNDPIHKVEEKVETVKQQMEENIRIALENIETVVSIEATTQDLELLSHEFNRKATELKNQYWWENVKVKLIVAGIILVFLGIIIGVSVYYAKKYEEAAKDGTQK